MSFNLGDLVAKLKLEDGEFTSKLGGVKGKAAQAGEESGSAMSNAFRGAMGRIGDAVSSMFGNLAAMGVAKLLEIGKSGIQLGVSVAAQMEQADIAFTTMLGSAEKAGSFIRDLQDFAAKTPFDFPGLQSAASSLISIGIDSNKVIPIMTTLGNVTSGMGTGAEGVKRATVALQQMNAAGKITGEDLNQLRDAGIPVFDLLAAATGKSKEEVSALAQAGKLGKKELEQLMSALESGKGMERFAGLMDKQADSLLGMWSTLEDTVGMGLAKAFEPALPLIKQSLGAAAQLLENSIFPAIVGGLTWVMTAATGLYDLFAKGDFSQSMADAFQIHEDNAVLGFIFDLRDAATELYSILIKGDYTGRWAEVFGIQEDSPIIGLLFTLREGVMGLMQPTSGVAAAAMSLFTTYQMVWGGIQAIIAAAIPVVVPIIDTIAQVLFNSVIPAVMGMYTAIQGWVQQVLPIVISFVTGMMARIEPMVPTIQMIFTTIGEIITTAFEIIKAVTQPAINMLVAFWDKFGERIMNVVGAVFSQIVNVISGALSFISNIIKAVLAAINGDWDGAWNYLKAAASALWNTVIGIFKGNLDILNAAVGDGLQAVLNWFSGLPGKITSAIGNLGSLLINAGSAIMQGFLTGLKNSWGAVTDFVGGIASWIAANKGPLSYDLRLLKPAGKAIMKGFNESLRDGMPSLERTIGDITAAVAGTQPVVTATVGAGTGGNGTNMHNEFNVTTNDPEAAAQNVLSKLEFAFA